MSQQENIERIAKSNFEAWNSALQTKDPEAVVALYSENLIFLPTLSSKFIKSKDEAIEYFEHFLKKNPVAEIIDEAVQLFGHEGYAHSGKYNFTIGQDDTKQIVEARFTFIWKQDGEGRWEIVNHHSSLSPQ
ncbi:MAG: SgcJ/EcaC family oxidoreductase [Patescibacteria group bacterium]